MAPTDPHFRAEEWSAYVDGEVGSARREEMRSHLQACAECRTLARSYEAVQRGAEELAQRATPPPPNLRTRLLAVSVTVLGQERSRQRWLALIATLFLAATLGVLLWRGRPQEQHLPVGVTINNVLITRLLIYPPSLDYELTIQNHSNQPLIITRVVTKDPLGEVERPVYPPLRVEAGQTAQRVFGRLVPENSVLPAGQYQLWLVTGTGNLHAEKKLAENRK